MIIATLLIALACLAAGIVIGYLLNREVSPEGKQHKSLKEQLQKKENELRDYQQEVTEHFVRTSELVNNLTQSYRDVHEHLAASAMNLANPEVSRQLLEAGSDNYRYGNSKSRSNILTPEAPTPPKDYAPKVPGGILSEEYGLKDDKLKGDSPQSGLSSSKMPSAKVIPHSRKTYSDSDFDDNDDDPTLKVG